MALRTFIRLLALATGMALASLLAWNAVSFLPILAGAGLLILTLGYLALSAGGGDFTRWQLRYRLEGGEQLTHLEEVLRFLAEKTGHFVVEATARGLFLELPQAFDRYVEAQLPKALLELKLSRVDHEDENRAEGPSFFCVGAPGIDLLRWATEAEGRQVRLHIHQGPYATLTAQTDGQQLPGRWLRIPGRFERRLPVWDELSAGVRLNSLLPPTGDGAVYSSRSRLLHLVPPDDYTPDPTGRTLGKCTGGRPLTFAHNAPLFTVGAPASFMVRQALDDLEKGRAVVVASPHRHLLGQIAQQAQDTAAHWLDPQDSSRSAHLAIVGAEEWDTTDAETLVQALQTLLADLGIDVGLPAIGDFTHRLLHTLAEFARQAARDLAFTDLYAVSQSVQALSTFLENAPGEAAQSLLAQLDDDGGYVQAVTTLSAIRTALKPLGSRALHALCQPPFFNAGQALRAKNLLLVPMTNSDFPEHDRLLSAMLDLALNRVLAAGDDVDLALHLHDPHFCRDDAGQRWIDIARRDSRLSLLLDVQEPNRFMLREGVQVIFRCSEALAVDVIVDWKLPVSTADLTEMPPDTAVACLPDMVVTLKVSDE